MVWKMSAYPSISVVIPVYNSSRSLPELIRQLKDQLDELTSDYEIIAVDDDSPDNSWMVLQELKTCFPMLKPYRLMSNSGQHAATLCGLSLVKNEIVVTMDDDLQHRPDQLRRLLDSLLTAPEIDCVFGVFQQKQHRAYRNLASHLLRRINQAAFNLPSGVATSGFRVMRKHLAQRMSQQASANPSLVVILLNCSRKVKSLNIPHASRYAGRSNYTVRKQFRLALDNICNATMLPLRLVSFCGFATTIFTIFLIIFYLIRYCNGQILMPGWTTLILLLSFFSGVIMLSLGVVGEYLVRILREVNKKPPYLIRDNYEDSSLPLHNS